jgi:hypothetical protein
MDYRPDGDILSARPRRAVEGWALLLAADFTVGGVKFITVLG